jgi:hypothetical protein
MEWPQEVDAPEGTIVVYQPQPEKLTGNTLTGRSAMSLELKGKEEPIFGVFWYTARLDSSGDDDTVLVRDLIVSDVKWPDSNDVDEQRFTKIIEDSIPSSGFEISRERLSASLETAELERKSLSELKHDPPEIIFTEQLAVLLMYDGKPKFKPVENSNYERVLNTPMMVARNTYSKRVYLSSGTLWYEAKDPMGPWNPLQTPPSDLAAMLPKPDADEQAPATRPAIVVATKPTELVASAGKPNWESLGDGTVMYVKNTETPWLRDLPTGNMYILLSGRWYRSKSESGPWTFVPADNLPASFADIPPASDIGGLRTSVAGTPEAEDALRDASIPQTAAIKRSDASLTVQYDGKPKFEKISGTNVAYAVNTGAQVLRIDKKYYAVDNGVWFFSASATGPWAVADSVPEQEIAKIPPSSPAYNTTYVHIYQSTPQVVYVGYTPGYMWSFPYYGVPVYGTGWYYPPYWGRYYYPRPPTWGFHVGYNPWTGWNYGVSWSNGFFSMGASWGGGYGHYRPGHCCGGWYGGGYHQRPIVINNNGNINIGNTINVGNRANIGNAIANHSGNNFNKNNFNKNNFNKANLGQANNLYKRPENRARIADATTAKGNLKQARPVNTRENNVFAGRNGEVARNVDGNWQTRANGKWKNDPSLGHGGNVNRPSTGNQAISQARPTTRPAQPAQQVRPATRPAQPTQQVRPATRPAQQYTRPAQSHQQMPQTRRQDYNRAYSARQQGVARERSMRGGGGGGFHGGGGGGGGRFSR